MSETILGRKLTCVVLVGGLVLAAIAALELPGNAMAADQDSAKTAIRKVLEDQAAAWNKGDLEGFMAGYLKSDELTFFSGGKVTKGWQATLDNYRKRYQGDGKEMGKLTFSDLDVSVLSTENSIVRGHWKVEMSSKTPEGLFTLWFHKEKDGWRIVHDHTSAQE
jgi:beta-aspartyl-peptidase (threonine type)